MKALGLLLVLGATGLWAHAGSGHAVDPLANENAVVRADRARIAAHLQRVEMRLRGADVSNLTPAQQERRAQALDRLGDYRQNEIFPHNHDFINQVALSSTGHRNIRVQFICWRTELQCFSRSLI